MAIELETWARLRTVFANGLPTGSHNYEYDVGTGWKSASIGNGYIRADTVSVSMGFQVNFGIGAQNPQTNPTPPPSFKYDFYLQLNWWDSTISPQSTLVPKEIQDQLTGETVTTTAGGYSFAITSDLFTATNGKQVFATGATVNPVSVASIGKLSAIT